MTASIISRATIEQRARKAFFAGLPRTAHNMNWHATALACWLAEYDRCASQQNHVAMRTDARVDAAQVSA